MHRSAASIRREPGPRCSRLIARFCRIVLAAPSVATECLDELPRTRFRIYHGPPEATLCTTATRIRPMLREIRRRTCSCIASALIATCGAALSNAVETAPACRSTASGDLQFHQLHSRVFGNVRTLRILLPPGYDVPESRSRRYPVLYLLDGQNLFDACLSDVSHREWRVDETVYRLIAARALPPLIVVGIDHAGRNRAHEYLPYRDQLADSSMPEPAGKRPRSRRRWSREDRTRRPRRRPR